MAGTEHDYDGHGGCVVDCRVCEIERLRAELARVQQELTTANNAARMNRDSLQVALQERDQARERAEQAVKHQNENAYAAVVLKEQLEAARTALQERERAACYCCRSGGCTDGCACQEAVQAACEHVTRTARGETFCAKCGLAQQPPAPVRAEKE